MWARKNFKVGKLEIPSIGFGTFQLRQLDDLQLATVISTAFENGYRLFDLAEVYRNSKQIYLEFLKVNGIY